MAKMDLASKSWCEMVFANRNQAYGAYQLRAELGKRNQIALIVVLALIVIGLLVPLFLKFVIPQKKDDTITEVTNFSKLKEAEVKDQHIKKVQPKQPQQEVQRIKSSIKFTAPVIKEDDQVNEADEMKTQEALGKSQLTISIADVKGNDEEHGKDVADLKEVITSQKEETKVYTVVEQMPSFPGGEDALLKYIGSHIKYPSVALEQGIQGMVMLRFVVNPDGHVGEVQVLKSLDPYCDREAKRVIQSLPKFIPGKQQGRAPAPCASRLTNGIQAVSGNLNIPTTYGFRFSAQHKNIHNKGRLACGSAFIFQISCNAARMCNLQQTKTGIL